MKTPTQKERNKIYRSSLKWHDQMPEDSYTFLCTLIALEARLMSDDFAHICVRSVKGYFPELKLMAPSDRYAENRMPWFNFETGFESNYNSPKVKTTQRIILEFLIAMTNERVN